MNLARARTIAAYVVLAAVAVVLVGKAAMPLDNLDTYFHLRFGHEFLTGAWSLRHPGSVTRFATADWVPTQWLPQVVMAQLEEWFGLPGVAWLAGLLFLSLGLAIYVACRRQAEPLVAAIVVALTLEACTSGMSMRPQQLSYLLVVVTTAAWLRARETGRPPWWLVPLTWVWTMCHGMWPIGIVIGLVAVAGLALDREHPRRVLLRMLAVPVLSALASLLTPVGPGLLGAVLRVSSRAEYFYEWGPPRFTELPPITLLALLALAIVPRMRRGRVPWFELVLIGLAALWAVYSMRTVPVAACLVAPLAAAGIQSAVAERPPVPRRERIGVAAGYVLALATLALVVPHTADEPLATPVWLDDALSDLPPGTAVVDETAYGGYLMWRFPQLDLVIHGYGDTFTDAELERNADLDAARAGWRELLLRTGAQYAVLPPGSPLAYNLRTVEHWQVLERSPEVELLQAPPGWAES